MFVPDWWLLRPPGMSSERRPGSADPVLPGVDTGRRARKDSQAARRRPSQPALGALASSLLANELFRARARTPQLQSMVLRAVDYLEQRDGFASLQDLADALGEPFFRMGGVVSRMQTVLNVEGEPILERPPEGTRVKLNVAALRQQFEVQR
jgi:hypothetical protein